METMGCRNEELQKTVNGFTDTGIPLIAKDPNLDAINGILYRDAGFADDTGIYYFVPWIIRTFGLSVESGVNALVTGLVVIGLIIGICSFFYIFINWYSRFFAILAQIFLPILCINFKMFISQVILLFLQ